MKYKHKNLLNFIEKIVYVSKKDYNNFSSRYEYIKVICLTFLLGYNELVKCANPKCNKKICHCYKNKSELHKYCSTKCKNIDFKRLFNGSNNPMYGKKWSDSARLKQSVIISEQMKNHDRRFNNQPKTQRTKQLKRRKISKFASTRIGNKNPFYGHKHSKQTIECIRQTKSTQKYKEQVRKTREKLGLQIPLNLKDDYEIYSKFSNWNYDVIQYIDDPKQLQLLKLYGFANAKNHKTIGITRDHMYSRKSGFINGVFPEILRHPANCKLMLNYENSSKGSKNSITLEQLFQLIQNYDKSYFDQNNCIILINDYKAGLRWKNPYK